MVGNLSITRVRNIGLLILSSSLIAISIRLNLLTIDNSYFSPIIAQKKNTLNDENTVLVIHSYHPTLQWTASLRDGIDKYFKGSNTVIFHEYLDAKNYPQLAHGKELLTDIKQKYSDQSIDVLIVSDDPGLALVIDNRSQLFPQTPLVFLGINNIDSELIRMPNTTGVFENHRIEETIEIALEHTKKNELIVINNSSETGKANQHRLDTIQKTSKVLKNTISIVDLPSDRIDQVFEDISPDLPVLLLGALRQGNKTGPLIEFTEGSRLLRSKIPNPIYSETESYIGHGVVGGKVLKGERHAQQAAKLVKRILNGDSPETIDPIEESEHLWMFDANELKRFNIPISDLPLGSQVINQTPSLYVFVIWITTSIFTFSLSILLYRIYRLRQREKVQQIRFKERQRIIVRSYNAIHNGPLQKLKGLIRQVSSEKEKPSYQTLDDELNQIDEDLRNIYEFMEQEYLRQEESSSEAAVVHITPTCAVNLHDPLHELLYHVYRSKLKESSRYFGKINPKVLDFCPMNANFLSLAHKEEIIRFLEEALCNIEQHAVGVTRLVIACKQENNQNIRHYRK